MTDSTACQSFKMVCCRNKKEMFGKVKEMELVHLGLALEICRMPPTLCIGTKLVTEAICSNMHERLAHLESWPARGSHEGCDRGA